MFKEKKKERKLMLLFSKTDFFKLTVKTFLQCFKNIYFKQMLFFLDVIFIKGP